MKIFQAPEGGYFRGIYLLEAFTPRTWLRSASNFGKTRFRRFATFDFSTPKKRNRRRKKIAGAHFFLKNCFFLKIWPSKSGYRQLHRPKSLPRMRFSDLYDASPARNINVCVFDLDLGRKTTSRGGVQKFHWTLISLFFVVEK